jgi:hypothetical protein
VEGDQLCIRVGVAYKPTAVSEVVLALIAMIKDRFSDQGADIRV